MTNETATTFTKAIPVRRSDNVWGYEPIGTIIYRFTEVLHWSITTSSPEVVSRLEGCGQWTHLVRVKNGCHEFYCFVF